MKSDSDINQIIRHIVEEIYRYLLHESPISCEFVQLRPIYETFRSLSEEHPLFTVAQNLDEITPGETAVQGEVAGEKIEIIVQNKTKTKITDTAGRTFWLREPNGELKLGPIYGYLKDSCKTIFDMLKVKSPESKVDDIGSDNLSGYLKGHPSISREVLSMAYKRLDELDIFTRERFLVLITEIGVSLLIVDADEKAEMKREEEHRELFSNGKVDELNRAVADLRNASDRFVELLRAFEPAEREGVFNAITAPLSELSPSTHRAVTILASQVDSRFQFADQASFHSEGGALRITSSTADTNGKRRRIRSVAKK